MRIQKKETGMARREFSKVNERNSFISVRFKCGRIMQMNDLLNDKFNTQNDSGCG
jgi:hypothetical protein